MGPLAELAGQRRRADPRRTVDHREAARSCDDGGERRLQRLDLQLALQGSAETAAGVVADSAKAIEDRAPAERLRAGKPFGKPFGACP